MAALGETITLAPTPTALLRTLVLCDLADSTALIERLGDRAAAELIRSHDRLVRDLVAAHEGREIDKTDGFLLVFERPIQAVAFALDYQRQLAELAARLREPLTARVGIHVGDVVVWDNQRDDVDRGAKRTELEGLAKPITARLAQLALPGQILLSGTVYDIARSAQGELGKVLSKVRWLAHGRYAFKGVPDPVPVFEIGEEGIAPLKPPPWSSKAHREIPFWRRPIVIGTELLLLLVAILVPLLYLLKPQPAIAFANRDWVVVGDLRNMTGESKFDDSLRCSPNPPMGSASPRCCLRSIVSTRSCACVWAKPWLRCRKTPNHSIAPPPATSTPCVRSRWGGGPTTPQPQGSACARTAGARTRSRFCARAHHDRGDLLQRRQLRAGTARNRARGSHARSAVLARRAVRRCLEGAVRSAAAGNREMACTGQDLSRFLDRHRFGRLLLMATEPVCRCQGRDDVRAHDNSPRDSLITGISWAPKGRNGKAK